MPGLKKAAENPPKAYTGETVAPFTAPQVQGQQQVLGSAVPAQQTAANNALQQNQFLANDVLFPGTNPALQGYMDAAVRPIYQNLTEQALPAVRQEAIGTGGFGGSRQGIAEGLASRGASQAAGDVSSKIASEGYGQGLDAYVKGLALTPTVQTAQSQPGVTASGVGDVQQARDQALLDQQAQNYYFNQQAPFLTAQQIAGISAGIPGGSTTTSATTPKQNPLSTAIGAAATVAPLFI
jgi:hypothetical protein